MLLRQFQQSRLGNLTGLQPRRQLVAKVAKLHKAHLVLPIAPDQQTGRFGIRRTRMKDHTKALPRPLIRQQPSQWRPTLLRHLGLTDIQRQLNPLVMRQFEDKRRIARLGDIALLQPGEKFLTDLKKVRRTRLMLGDKTAHQALPATGFNQPVQHRKGPADKAFDIVEEQRFIHRHTLGADAIEQRLLRRLTNTRGKSALCFDATHVPYPLISGAANGAAAVCSWRICATSAYSSAIGGKLKSRSSNVGRTPCTA